MDSLVGNANLVQVLKKMFEQGIEKFPHSVLLTGPTGCGKTTIARIIADNLGAAGSDINEVDSADFRGIDTIREIRKNSHYKPGESACRVWIVDECHKMTNDAQNALLKILEDTPPHVYFILCTTEPQKLLPTVRGRCSTFTVNLLDEREMMTLLRSVVKEENDNLSKQIYNQIISDSMGHPRNALQILDQVLRVDTPDRLIVAEKTAEEQSQSIELCRALLNGASWQVVSKILKGLKDQEPEGIRRHVLGYCQSVLLNGSNDKAAHVIEEFWEPLYNIGYPGLIFCCYSVVNN